MLVFGIGRRAAGDDTLRTPAIVSIHANIPLIAEACVSCCFLWCFAGALYIHVGSIEKSRPLRLCSSSRCILYCSPRRMGLFPTDCKQRRKKCCCGYYWPTNSLNSSNDFSATCRLDVVVQVGSPHALAKSLHNSSQRLLAKQFYLRYCSSDELPTKVVFLVALV